MHFARTCVHPIAMPDRVQSARFIAFRRAKARTLNSEALDLQPVAHRVADGRAKIQGEFAEERAERVLKFFRREREMVVAVIIPGVPLIPPAVRPEIMKCLFNVDVHKVFCRSRSFPSDTWR